MQKKLTDKEKKAWVKKAMLVKSGKEITSILKRYWSVGKKEQKKLFGDWINSNGLVLYSVSKNEQLLPEEMRLKKVMSNLGKSSWEKRVDKYGLEKALQMLRDASKKGNLVLKEKRAQTASWQP